MILYFIIFECVIHFQYLFSFLLESNFDTVKYILELLILETISLLERDML